MARRILHSAAAVVALVGVFGPWLRSGASTRSSFELFDLVERLGFAPDGVFALIVRFWPMVPLLVVIGVVACWAGRTRICGAATVVAGLYVAGVAGGVTRAPRAGLVRIEWGVGVAAVGGLGLLLAAGWSFVVSRTTRPVPPSPT